MEPLLTWVSEIEVIFYITRYVVFNPEFLPVCIRLFIVPDENAKQDDHGHLPDEADRRQTNPHIGVLVGTKEPVPHRVHCVQARMCTSVILVTSPAGLNRSLRGGVSAWATPDSRGPVISHLPIPTL